MRVLLDTTYARRAPHSGTAVYLECLQAALAARGDVSVVAVANERRRAPAGGGWGSLANALADARWSQLELPRLVRRHRAELIHHPLPAHSHAARVPQVITVHDLAFLVEPAAFAPAYRTWARRAHGAAARRASVILCPSAATAAQLIQRWPGAIPPAVVPHGPGQSLPSAERGAPEHFLYVGDAEPRKRLGLLLDAYARYRADAGGRALALVLAGGVPGRFAAPGVRHAPNLDRAGLAALHAHAAALVHPAHHEGFGLTLLEAMAAGTPVLAIAGGAVTEVCGDAAWLLSGPDPVRLAAALHTLATNPARRAQLARDGHRRAAAFSWERSAAAHAAAYAQALAAYPSALRR